MKYARMGVLLALLLVCFTFVPLQSVHAAEHTVVQSMNVEEFAEGRVGEGVSDFKTFYTAGNPTTSACNASVKYIYTLDGDTSSNTKTVNFTIPAMSRYTVNGNADVPVSRPATLSAVFSVCDGVTVERPMYVRNFNGVNSGSEIEGNTSPSKTWDFADVPTHNGGESFLAVLNPNDTASTVSVAYYNASGANVANESMTVNGNSRATFQPGNNPQVADHVSALVSSDLPIVVERPSYYGALGASDISGVPVPLANWYFAEGNTGVDRQESLTIANVTNTVASVTVTLKSTSGHMATFPITVNAHAQATFDVNDNNNFSGATSEVAADVQSTAANIVVQRHMIGVYTSVSEGWQAQYITDTTGAAAAASSFQFAEGFTSVRYAEELLLQNPTNTAETVTVKLLNMLSHSYTQTYALPAESRYTVDIKALVSAHLAQVGEDSRAYAVSMVASSADGTFVAERSMYFHTPPTFETQGANSIVGFSN